MSVHEHRQRLALQAYVEARPALRQQLATLPLAQHAAYVQQALDEEAAALHIAPWELHLQLLASSPEELAALQLAAHREIAEFANMPWAEYCALTGCKA
ncbi:hypothetical protein BK634_15795 [Pseudomonas chlororaphis]|nr:hypothetical protein BK634_15795 [Pseudomonas chlororaphis]WEK12175.1 MAG: DUF6388 family protein [Pseudomonas sp.]